MGALSADEGVWCSACRGKGWRFVSSREGLADRVTDDGAELAPRADCERCSGSGRVGSLALDESTAM